MMAGASVMALDEWMSVRGNNPQKPLNYVERAVRKSALIWGIITAAFVLFLVFVKWSKSEPSKIYNKPLFAAFSIVSVAGTVLTWHIVCRLRQKQIVYLALSVFVFSCATCITDIAMLQAVHGRGAQEIYDELNTTAALTDPAPYYRFTSRDNIETLAHNRQGSANFCSTVSGSIFRFYEALGLERDVKSPDAPEGLMNLISARYAIEDEPREDETFIEERSGKDCSFYVYEDKDVPPIGFTYDTYMTATELEVIASANRAVAMLRTLVIPDEEVEKVSEVLAHYSKAVHGGTEPADIPEASRAHLSECAREAVRTTSSYGVTITADADKYAFFSIPNDGGWTAKVNGEDTEILDICGFMAVRIHEGENRIEFTYTVPGLFAGIIISLAGLLDPYATYGRFASSALEPAAAWLANLVGGALAANGHECMIRQEMVLRGACAFAFAVSVGIAVIACAMWKGRLVCNTVCPVGALLGACAVRPLVQVRIDADACVKCRMCERACRAQCVDVEKGAVDQSRCVRCFECISACRKGAIRWTARKARK